jgi:FkbM family methyltransferase
MPVRATASRAATLLAKNPSLFCRIALAKLNTARPLPALPARKRIRDVVFEYDLPGYRGTAPMYFGSYALPVVHAMERILRPGDTFLDVGANIGYLSAIAAGLVGPKGQVHSFEPVPAYYARLYRLAEMNPDYRIHANCCAAGETPGTAKIYVTREAGQNTMVAGYKTAAEIVSTADVTVVRLDSYIGERHLSRVALIKIDAEGFELPILKGLRGYWESTGQRPPILCEIAPGAFPLMKRSLGDLADYILQFGYTARDLIDSSAPVDLKAIRNVEDVLFIATSEAQ